MLIHGNDVLIYHDGAAIAGAKSCSIDVKAETIEISSPSQGEWKDYITGRKEWSATTSHLIVTYPVTDTALRKMLLRVGETFAITLKVRGYPDDTLSGTAICTACQVTATRGSLAQGSFSWQGIGALEYKKYNTFDETFDETYD